MTWPECWDIPSVRTGALIYELFYPGLLHPCFSKLVVPSSCLPRSFTRSVSVPLFHFLGLSLSLSLSHTHTHTHTHTHFPNLFLSFYFTFVHAPFSPPTLPPLYIRISSFWSISLSSFLSVLATLLHSTLRLFSSLHISPHTLANTIYYFCTSQALKNFRTGR